MQKVFLSKNEERFDTATDPSSKKGKHQNSKSSEHIEWFSVQYLL